MCFYYVYAQVHIDIKDNLYSDEIFKKVVDGKYSC